MNTQNTISSKSFVRQNFINGLAVVGFVALIVAGIALAIYVSRFAPQTIARLNSATVTLSQLFSSPSSPSISIVPNASTTIPFSNVSSTTKSSTSTRKTHIPTIPAKTHIASGARTNHVYQINSSSTPAHLPIFHGLPNLVVQIIATGYLTSTSTDSFVATTTIPHGARVAVKFTIKNTGTNIAVPWKFSATIPTQTNYVFVSPLQQPLNPNDHIDYVLGFDQAISGTDKMISINVDSTHTVAESNEKDNSAFAKVTILGQ